MGDLIRPFWSTYGFDQSGFLGWKCRVKTKKRASIFSSGEKSDSENKLLWTESGYPWPIRFTQLENVALFCPSDSPVDLRYTGWRTPIETDTVENANITKYSLMKFFTEPKKQQRHKRRKKISWWDCEYCTAESRGDEGKNWERPRFSTSFTALGTQKKGDGPSHKKLLK